MQVERESTFGCEYSGARVSNTWVTYLLARDNTPKGMLIPHTLLTATAVTKKGWLFELSPDDGPASHQLVGEVMAHQGLDA